MAANIKIYRWTELSPSNHLVAGIDDIFFASSNTTSFASDVDRQVFRDRWLGRYLEHDAATVLVALQDENVVGYLAGCLVDPASVARFRDIAYFATFKDLTCRFPAHLHVNIAPAFRGEGLGRALVERFCNNAQAAGCPGAHVVTSKGARNVGFYTRNGFLEQSSSGDGDRAIVFLGRPLLDRYASPQPDGGAP
jgi:GNAT superfamily N-acetyltransferase